MVAMIAELHKDVDKCNLFVDQLKEAVDEGRTKKARKILMRQEEIQETMIEAGENIKLMLKEIEDGRARLI